MHTRDMYRDIIYMKKKERDRVKKKGYVYIERREIKPKSKRRWRTKRFCTRTNEKGVVTVTSSGGRMKTWWQVTWLCAFVVSGMENDQKMFVDRPGMVRMSRGRKDVRGMRACVCECVCKNMMTTGKGEFTLSSSSRCKTCRRWRIGAELTVPDRTFFA